MIAGTIRSQIVRRKRPGTMRRMKPKVIAIPARRQPARAS
jgi:hypothetical protein